MISERNGKAQMDPLFPRLGIHDTEKEETTRTPPRNKMAMCEESVSMPAFHDSDLKPSGSQNHRQKSESRVFDSYSKMYRAEMQKWKRVYNLKEDGKTQDIEDILLNEKLTYSSSSTSTSGGNTALLTDGIYERIGGDNIDAGGDNIDAGGDNNDMEVNGCCRRDNIDVEVGNAGGKSTSISTTEFGGIQFWQVRETIIHQQGIFAKQVFELHRVIEVQRLVAESPEILFEEMLHFSNHSTKFSPVKELPVQIIWEETPSLLKSKVDSERPNSRLKTTGAVQDLRPYLPFIECNTKKKGPSSTRSCPSWYRYPHPDSQFLIPERSHSDYGSCGVPTLSQLDLRVLPCSLHLVEALNPGKSFAASKGSNVYENVVRSRAHRTVHGDTLSLFPVDSLFQASIKEIPK